MADNVNITINFADAKAYKGRESDGPAACLPFDGFVPAKVKKFRTSVAESSGNSVVTIIMDVAEEGLGGTLYAPIPVTGHVKSGNREGEPNVFRFFEFLESAGWSKAKINELATSGTNMPLDQIMSDLIARGTVVYPNCKAEEYNNKLRSKVQGFTTKDYYDQAMVAGTARDWRDDSKVGATAPRTTSSNGTRAGGRDPLAGVLAG